PELRWIPGGTRSLPGGRMAGDPTDIETIIDQVAASYRQGRLVDSPRPAPPPNKRQGIEAPQPPKALIYLRDYSTGAPHDTQLRHGVSSHIYPAFEILTEQIRRAVSYEGFRTATAARGPDWPKQTAVDLLSGIPRLRALLSKDVLAAFQGDPAANSV